MQGCVHSQATRSELTSPSDLHVRHPITITGSQASFGSEILEATLTSTVGATP